MPAPRPLDYLLAFVGWSLVLGVVAFPAGATLLPPDPYSTLPVFVAVAVLAAPLARWYLRAGHSLGDLGSFYFAVVAVEVTLGFALYTLTRVTDLPSVGHYSYGALVVVLTTYLAAYWLVYRDGWARLRSWAM